MFAIASSAFMAPYAPSKVGQSIVMAHGGKGFGGGEATRDPEPTVIDPNDPKAKQQAIHKAVSFAEYLAQRNGAAAAPAPASTADTTADTTSFADYLAKRNGAAAAPAPVSTAAYSPPAAAAGGKGFGGGEATRDPAPTYIDPNDPKAKQLAIHKAESFADYMAKRNGATAAAPVPVVPNGAPVYVAAAPAAVDEDAAKRAWLAKSVQVGWGQGRVVPTAAVPAPAAPAPAASGMPSFAEYMASRK